MGVAGVDLRLLDSLGAPVLDGSGTPITAGSDAAGLYEFAVGPGDYIVEIDVPSGAVLTSQDVGVDDAVDSDFSTVTLRTSVIAVAAGEDLPAVADAGIRPPLLGDYVWEDLNLNGRQDPGEPPVAGVTVTAYAAGDVGGVALATETTDASGFYLMSLPVGTYQLAFAAPANTRFTTQSAPAATPSTDSDVDALGVTDPIVLGVFTIDFDSADAGVVRLGSIGDRVFLDTNENGAWDAGEGIPNVDVVLTLPDTSTATTVTGPDGFYEFTALEAGNYSVAVDELDPQFPSGVIQTAGSNPVAVALSAGQEFNDADFGYEPTGSIGDFVWLDLNGDGVQDGGAEAGISGVTVDLYNDVDGSGTVTGGDTLVGTETTDGSGAYDFTGLVPGDYVVTVTDTGGAIPPSNADRRG